MGEMLSLGNLVDFLLLFVLQTVLTMGNVLGIGIEAGRAPLAQQSAVRFWGIGSAVILRIVVFLAVLGVLNGFGGAFLHLGWDGVITGGIGLSTLAFAVGGAMLILTAIKEIARLLSVEHLDNDLDDRGGRPGLMSLIGILGLNVVYAFEGTIAALALTTYQPVIFAAFLLPWIGVLILRDELTLFLSRRRMVEVGGLFILLAVGILALGMAGTASDPVAPISVLGVAVTPMSQAAFYTTVIVLIAVVYSQSSFARKLAAARKAAQK
jgi:predicted tellurium resistance membrane protein TerC